MKRKEMLYMVSFVYPFCVLQLTNNICKLFFLNLFRFFLF